MPTILSKNLLFSKPSFLKSWVVILIWYRFKIPFFICGKYDCFVLFSEKGSDSDSSSDDELVKKYLAIVQQKKQKQLQKGRLIFWQQLNF